MFRGGHLASPFHDLTSHTPVSRHARRFSPAVPRPRSQWEDDRSAVARQLHDGFGQPLTTLLMEVDRARSEGILPLDVLDRIEGLARAALRNARQVVLDIGAAEDDRDPLDAARDYSESTLAIGGCELVWEAMPDFRELPLQTARHLAAVIRESVTNIVRHAAAQTIHVRLRREGDNVVVTVEDDGVGLAGPGLDAGYGLRSNRDLAAALGGSFTVQPRVGGGTMVRFDAVVRADD